MKILIVSNQLNSEDSIPNPVLQRMKDALLRDRRVSSVALKPVCYSFSGMKSIRSEAKNNDIVHIHFGGMYALAVYFFLIGVKKPKLITFHGTDIHAKAINTSKRILTRIKIKLNQYASFISIMLFDRVGFVAKEMECYVPKCLNHYLKNKAFVQPLGVDYDVFKEEDSEKAKDKLNLDRDMSYVLFSDISNTCIKRRDIATRIVDELGGKYRLLIMCGVSPKEVPIYINSCDFLLLTSDEEGSPNIIREALALNKPVFSVDVGDAAKQLKGLSNSSIISRDYRQAAREISSKISRDYIDNTREAKRNILDFVIVNKAVIDIYQKMIIR